jgi:hypothetical protein
MRFILLLFLAFSAQAQPTRFQNEFWSSPNYSFTADTETAAGLTTIADGTGKFYGSIVSPSRGYLKAGVVAGSMVDMNGVGGTAVGGYFVAEGRGRAGPIQNEVVGVYARANNNGAFWATALHGECMVRQPDIFGGLCIGLNLELQRKNDKSGYIGVNVQPGEHARDVVGLQFQRGSAYRWAVDVDGAFIKLGQVDDVSFCMRFVGERQSLEFWRGCGRSDATRHGWVNMNWGTPDVQLNR